MQGKRGAGGARWAPAMPLDSYRFLPSYYLDGDCSGPQLLARVFSAQVFG